MTPAQLNVYARARSEALAARQRLTAANLYNLATMIRGAVWGEHGLPPFEKMFPEAASARSMSDEAMFRQVQALNKLFGGEEA